VISKPSTSYTLPFLEPVLTLIISLLFLFVGKAELAGVTAIIGGFQAVSRIAMTRTLNSEMVAVKKLAEAIDLQRECSITGVQQMLMLYLQVTEPEFRSVKETIISEATDKLRQLAHERSSPELATGDYYSWLLPIIDQSKKDSELWAVSMMLSTEWDSSPAEERFLQGNLDAAKRGVKVQRIFVAPRDLIEKMKSLDGVKAHAYSDDEHPRGYFVEREYLQGHDPQLLREIGDGFIGFDSRVALIDVYSPEGFARGRVTMNPSEIAKYRRLFDGLKLNSRELKTVVSP
jgi:hypothetical protein